MFNKGMRVAVLVFVGAALVGVGLQVFYRRPERPPHPQDFLPSWLRLVVYEVPCEDLVSAVGVVVEAVGNEVEMGADGVRWIRGRWRRESEKTNSRLVARLFRVGGQGCRVQITKDFESEGERGSVANHAISELRLLKFVAPVQADGVVAKQAMRPPSNAPVQHIVVETRVRARDNRSAAADAGTGVEQIGDPANRHPYDQSPDFNDKP